MEERMATDVLVSVLARLYEQIFLLGKNADSGKVIQEGNYVEVNDFDAWCKMNFEHCYEGDDVALFLKKISAETIVQALTYEDEYVVEFSERVNLDDIRRKRIKAFTCSAGEVVCVCVDDVTEQYMREQNRERIAQACLEVAQQANIEKERVWQRMSEELRLPAYQAIELLKNALEADGEEVQEYIKKTQVVLQKYYELCETVFSVSVMEKGEEFEGEQLIFVKDLAEDIRQMTALGDESAKCDITLGDMAERVNAFLSDGTRLKQMLSSAVTAMANAGADKTVSAVLDFDMRKETEEEIEVSDLLFTIRGKEISDSVMQDPRMLFAQRFADCMDGIICFTTQEETALLIRIPIQRADKERQKEARKLARMEDSIVARNFAAFRALVVDDDAIGCEITASKLKQFGLQVETAADGQEAMEKLLASPGRYYQILFTKMFLPRKSGLELTMELRELKRSDLNDITIVALTSNPLRDKRIRALEHGMDHHLVLPFNDIELKEILIRELEDLGPEDAPEKFGFRVLK